MHRIPLILIPGKRNIPKPLKYFSKKNPVRAYYLVEDLFKPGILWPEAEIKRMAMRDSRSRP